MSQEDDDNEVITPTRVQVLPPTPNITSTPHPQPSSALPFQLDPISTIVLFPFLPIIQFLNMQMQMINQLSQQTQNQKTTKITSITRNGNTLDIVEKWL